MKTLMLDGGLGRVICSTGAVGCLAEPPNIITGWLDVYEFNETINKQYPMNHCWLFDDVIRGTDFSQPEPYHCSAYMQQKYHLSQAFNFLITGKPSLVYPKIFLTQKERSWGINFVNNIRDVLKKQIIAAYQPFGASFSGDGDETQRSMSLEAATFLASNIDAGLLNCTQINMNHPNIWHREFTTRELFAVVNACDFIIGVDSCVQHIGAAFNKSGVVILGGTYAENVGWPHYLHVSKASYPRSYFANRFSGFKNLNDGAMNFSRDELLKIAHLINSKAWDNILLPTGGVVDDPIFIKETL